MRMLFDVNAGLQTDGIINSAKKTGHECAVWDSNNSPVFDAFDKFKPEIFFGEYINRGTAKCIDEYGAAYVTVSQMWPFTFTINDKRIKNFECLIDNAIFNPYVSTNQELACDLAVIGPPEALIINFIEQNRKYNIKVFDISIWPTYNYMGVINNATKASLYASAKCVFTTDMMEAARALSCKKNPVVLTNQKESLEFLARSIYETTTIEEIRKILEKPEPKPVQQIPTYNMALEYILKTIEIQKKEEMGIEEYV